MCYGVEVFCMGGDEVVERCVGSVDGGLQLIPGGLDDFEEDVVLELIDEVRHFGDGAAGGFPVAC